MVCELIMPCTNKATEPAKLWEYNWLFHLKLYAMLKYTETILEKVSFSRELFRKELKKSLRFLEKEEVTILKAWCILNFGALYMDVIYEVFRQVSI